MLELESKQYFIYYNLIVLNISFDYTIQIKYHKTYYIVMDKVYIIGVIVTYNKFNKHTDICEMILLK